MLKSVLENLASITVTYNPPIVDNRLLYQLSTLSRICKICVLIDNGSKNIEQIRTLTIGYSNVVIIELKRNVGIAAALNLAVDYCKNIADIEWIITMDQDSYIQNDAIQNIELETSPYLDDKRIAAFGLNYEDFHFTRKKLVNSSKEPLYVNFLITSGCIVRKDIIERYNFDTDLFMYYVDTDFCKRLHHDHLKLVLLKSSFMFHKKGSVDVLEDGKEHHYNEPEKFYFFSRNSLVMLRRYFDIRGIAYLILLLMENVIANWEIPQTFWNLRRGFVDGLRYIFVNK